MAAQLAKFLINEITRVTEPMSGPLAMFEEADPGKYNCIRFISCVVGKYLKEWWGGSNMTTPAASVAHLGQSLHNPALSHNITLLPTSP